MNNNRQIARNLIYNSLSFGLNLLIAFFFTPYLINEVGKEAYGFYPLVENIISYTDIIVAAVGSMAGRFITMEYYKGNKEESISYFNTVIVAYFGLSVLFTIVGGVFVFYISDILSVPVELEADVRYLFVFALLSLVVRLSTLNFGLGTYVKNRIDLQSSRKVILSITRVAAILLLFYFFKPTIVYMSLAAFIAAIVGGVFDIDFKYKLLPEFKLNFKKYVSWPKLVILVSSGIWMSFNSLGNIFTTAIDLLFSNVFVGAAITGDFSIAKTVPALLLSIGAMLASTFTPHFNILFAEGKKEELLHEIKKSMIIITLLTSIPIGYLLVSSDYFLKLWVPSAYSDDLCWLSIISVIPVVFGLCTNTLFDIFTITNKRKYPAIALFITGIINVILMILLLKLTSMGVFAIAIAGAVTMSLRNLIFTPLYGAACLNIKWSYFYSILGRCLLCIISVVFITCFFRIFMINLTWVNLLLNMVGVTCVSCTINLFIAFNKQERAYLVEIISNKINKR